MKGKAISKNIVKQKMAIEHVACNPSMTIKELSKELNVDRKTAARWKNHPKFINAVYDRFMEIAGKELPLLLLALLREGKEGNTRAIELALKHWGKLQDTLVVRVEAPFMQHLKSKDSEITATDVIDITDTIPDADFSVLPERNEENARPMKKTRGDFNKTKDAIKKARRDANRNKRYDLRMRAFKVDLEPLPPGRPDPAKRRSWLSKLRRLEKKQKLNNVS